MSRRLYLGVDVGTTSIKAAAYDVGGQIVASAAIDSPARRERSNWSTQSMDAVWQRSCAAIREVASRIDAAAVASIGVCGQGDGLWALDRDRRPLGDAMLWNDQRAEQLITDWASDGTSAALARYCRTENWPGTAGALFAWLQRNDPQTAERVDRVLFCKDWINFKLTGNIATDYSDASIPFLDLQQRRYADAAFDLLGVPALAAKLAAPRAANSEHGRLRGEIADDLGLPPGIPVAVGSIDLAAMMAGRGLNRSGDICLILGTSAVVNVVVDPHPYGERPVGATLAHPFLDKWIRVLAPTSGASAIDWFASVHPESFTGASAAQNAELIAELAATSPPGANGVAFLPFLAGERAPFVAPQASASFIGLCASTTQADMARAVLEGVVFSLKHCFVSTGVDHPEQVFLTGGGARNRLWCEIVASVIDTRIVASDASDHGLWGAALIGASAAGFVDLANCPARSEDTRIHDPDPPLATTYRALFERYQQAVRVSSAIWELDKQSRTRRNA